MGEGTNVRKVIGRRIKDIRTAKNITLRQLSERSGVTAPKICEIEHGIYSVGIDVLYRITEALGAEIQIVSNIRE